MPPKRKAIGAVTGGGKVGKGSRVSTPAGAATPRSIGSDNESSAAEALSEGEEDVNIEKNVGHFSVEGYERPSKSATSHIFGKRDYSYLNLKPDFQNRPLWIDASKARIFLESFSPLAQQCQDFLITIAEPISRPSFVHEYALSPHSLYAAVSVGLSPADIINTLERFLKTPLPKQIREFIEGCTASFGKVKLVLKNTKYFVESADPVVLQKLLQDPIIGPLRTHTGSGAITTTAAPKQAPLVIPGTTNAAGVRQAGQANNAQGADADKAKEDEVYAALNDDDDEEAEVTHSFEIPDSAVEDVQKRCLDLQYPVLEEYDFRKDEFNANLEIDLRPGAQIRPYQEKSLSKMFGNGRAKSGIIVLPCGAGKTLVGITAACTVKKGVIVLCTSSMSVVQWRNEFLKWSNIKPEDIAAFTSDNKGQTFTGSTGIIVTTYSMVTQTRERSHEAKKMMDFLQHLEWGLMLLDEVHVVPANIFRKVTSSIKTHSKLGLTATLLQFYDEYLKAPPRKRSLLYIMNPAKFQACQYLINYHESRGDKIIVFSDNVYALKAYAMKLKKVFIYGETGQAERLQVLENFQHNPQVNTLFLSKIGDTSLDLPEATCLIQISSHYGSRRQEAQRLGRILRAKRRNDEGFNAFFYSLVSKDTSEMFYSSKRQAFLVDQGYAFKVITSLNNIEKTEDLAFSTAAERRELLEKVLVENVGNEEEFVDDLFHSGNMGRKPKKKGARRTAGMLGDLSGGQDMAYIEQNKKTKTKKGESSAFFRKIQRQAAKK
ncbi:General transcription and DNA repair factor IIH helicase subunit like protein [Verticillium longisporum]|uniref:DNA 3'-5' helicase n=1 Tax=Verticillium longisporum TaxID=100787 RepID=A0A8I3AU85_VERLO|nr:General transcription and DNA repair factor IIH helicase subunit like protein [Verticillium longisporum]